MDLLNHFFRKRTAGGGEEEVAENNPAASAGLEKKLEAGPLPSVEQTMAAAAARWRLDRERGLVSRPPAASATARAGLLHGDPQVTHAAPPLEGAAPLAQPAAGVRSIRESPRHPDPAPPSAAEVMLVLDDILPRLPTECLQPGLHDPERELRLSSDDLITGIARGRATIPLSKLAAHYPDIFMAPRGTAADVAVYLPLQKVLRQLSKAGSRPGGHAAPVAVDAPAPLAPRVEAIVAPAHRALPAQVAQTLLKPSLHGDLHGLAASTPPAPPAAKELPSAMPAAPAEIVTPAPRFDLPSDTADTAAPVQAEPVRTEVPETPPSAPIPATIADAPSPASEISAAKAIPPPVAETRPPLIADQSEAASPASAPPAPSASELPPEPPQSVPSRGHETATPPPLFAPKALRSIETAPATAAAPAVPLPFFAAHAPAPPPQTSSPPMPRVAPPPLRVPPPAPPSSIAAPALAETEIIAPEAATNAAPTTTTAAPLRIAPTPASVRPPAINLYAGVQIPPVSEPLKQAEPISERSYRVPEPDPIAEPVFTPEPPAYAPGPDDEPAPEAIVATPVPAPPAAPMIEYPIERIEQAPLQAIFMTEDALDLPRISELSANLPGVSGCLILAGESLAQGGERPAGLNAQTLRDLSDRLTAAAESVSDKLQADRTFTLYGGNRALSLFARQELCLCVVHGNRGFLPGVRERLTAVADTLARGLESAEE